MSSAAACPFDDHVCAAGLCRLCNPQPDPLSSVAEKRRQLEAMIAADDVFGEPDRVLFRAALRALAS